LWTDKYGPKKRSDIVGNRGVVDAFEEWFRGWEDSILRGKKK
jgi:hypothetical protein